MPLWLAGKFLLGMSQALKLMHDNLFLLIFLRFDLISFEERFIIANEIHALRNSLSKSSAGPFYFPTLQSITSQHHDRVRHLLMELTLNYKLDRAKRERQVMTFVSKRGSLQIRN